MTDIRLSHPTLKVLNFLLVEPLQERSGAEIAKCTGTASGTLYPMLTRLVGAKWLTRRWEVIDPRKAGRPRRRFYRLTALGQNEANKALRELQTDTAGGRAWQSS